MKLRYIMIWLDCPQIRWETDLYEYSFWWWMRRKGELPNTFLNFSWHLSPHVWENRYKEIINGSLKEKGHWCLWTKSKNY